MTSNTEFTCLRRLHAEILDTPHDRRLAVMKQRVIDQGGRWDLPSETPGVYEPVMMSIQLSGIFACAETLDELPVNWMRAAANVIQETPSGF